MMLSKCEVLGRFVVLAMCEVLAKREVLVKCDVLAWCEVLDKCEVLARCKVCSVECDAGYPWLEAMARARLVSLEINFV